jgi:hypothetical protein
MDLLKGIRTPHLGVFGRLQKAEKQFILNFMGILYKQVQLVLPFF